MTTEPYDGLAHTIRLGLEKAKFMQQLENLDISAIIVSDFVRDYFATKIIAITANAELKHGEEAVEIYQQLINS